MVEDKFKYDIIKESSVEAYEELPKHFLADSPEEAEKLYKEFYSTLNNLSYSYSLSTNIDKSDLFGEALIGLARARRDFDPSRSDNFKTFAIYKMKTVMNNYVRKNEGSVTTPSYIRNAHRHITLLKDLCEIETEALYEAAKEDTLDLTRISSAWIKHRATRYFELLVKAAKRAKISTMELVRRAESVPNDVRFDEYMNPEDVLKEREYHVNTAILIENIKKHMTPRQWQIAEGIMDGKSLRDIGSDLNISHVTVDNDLKKLRRRLEEKGITSGL